jgi:hypothetical protein
MLLQQWAIIVTNNKKLLNAGAGNRLFIGGIKRLCGRSL